MKNNISNYSNIFFLCDDNKKSFLEKIKYWEEFILFDSDKKEDEIRQSFMKDLVLKESEEFSKSLSVLHYYLNRKKFFCDNKGFVCREEFSSQAINLQETFKLCNIDVNYLNKYLLDIIEKVNFWQPRKADDNYEYPNLKKYSYDNYEFNEEELTKHKENFVFNKDEIKQHLKAEYNQRVNIDVIFSKDIKMTTKEKEEYINNFRKKQKEKYQFIIDILTNYE